MRFLSLILTGLSVAWATSPPPILVYSARVAGSSRELTVGGTAATADGSVIVAGQTNAPDFPQTRTELASLRGDEIFVTRLAPDGKTIQCSVLLGAPGDDSLIAMALDSDENVVLLGYTDAASFPVTIGSTPTSRSLFLMKLDPCQPKVIFSRLDRLDGLVAHTLALAPGGEICLAGEARNYPVPNGAWSSKPEDPGFLACYSPDGRLVTKATRLPGRPAALSVGPDGALAVAVNLSDRASQLFLFHPDLRSTRFTWDPPPGVGAGIRTVLVDSDGSTYVAGAAGSMPGAPGVPATAPQLPPTSFLSRLSPEGVLRFQQHLPPSVFGQGVDVFSLLPLQDKIYLLEVATPGVRAVSFHPATGLFRHFPAIAVAPPPPITVPPAPFAFLAINPSGRMALVLPGFISPTTVEALSLPGPAYFGVVCFDTAGDAPELSLSAGELLLFRSSQPTSAMEANLRLSTPPEGPSIPWRAKLLPDPRGNAAPFLSLDRSEGVTPDQLTITLPAEVNGGPTDAYLSVAVPGLRGGWQTIPVRILTRDPNPYGYLNITGEALEINGTNQRKSVSIHVNTVHLLGGNNQSPAPGTPFSLGALPSWLTVNRRQGLGPVALEGTIDSRGLAPGYHSGPVEILAPQSQRLVQGLYVGPVLRAPNSTRVLTLPAAVDSVSFELPLTSIGSPVEFSIRTGADWLSAEPSSGIAPATVIVTARWPSDLAADRISSSLTVQSSRPVFFPSSTITLQRRYSPAQIRQVINVGTPGGLGTVSGPFICDEFQARPSPWPFELGGCSVRVNDQDVPLSNIRRTDSDGILSSSLDLQLPYNLVYPQVRVEVRDKSGALFSITRPTDGYSGPGGLLNADPAGVRPGQSVSMRLTGFGSTQPSIAPGTLPVEGQVIQPIAPVEVFLGLRAAVIEQAQLSFAEVGVLDITFRVPDGMASGVHSVIPVVRSLPGVPQWILVRE